MEGAAAFILPGAGDGGNGGDGVHVDGAVARAGEAVAQAEIGALGLADELGEALDLGGGDVADFGGPVRRPGLQMSFELTRAVGVFLEIGPIGVAVAEQHMHDGAGESAIGAGADQQLHIRLLHGAGIVDVDAGDLRAALLARLAGVGHHVDLGVDRIAAPDDDQVRLLHLARIAAYEFADARDIARPG